MKGVEKQILNVVHELGKARAASIARRIGVQDSMVEAACEVLVEDGYLLRRGEKEKKAYILSEAGTDAVRRAVSRGPIPVLKGGGW